MNTWTRYRFIKKITSAVA